MRIASNWKLTFDPEGSLPLVILDFGQDFEGELRFPWRQDADERALVRSSRRRRYARGNAVSGLAFTTVKDHASQAAARLWCLQQQMVLDSFAEVTSTLKLEIEGDPSVFEMVDASIDEAESYISLVGKFRTLTAWRIGGSGWDDITP